MERSLRPTLTRPPDFEEFWTKDARGTQRGQTGSVPDAGARRVPPISRTLDTDISFAWRVQITGYSIAGHEGRTAAADRAQPRLWLAVQRPMEMGGKRIQRRGH